MDINNIRIHNDPTSDLNKKVEGLEKNQDNQALKRVCKDFESIFLNMMFKEMKNTIPDSGFIDKSTGTEIFEDMYIEELSKEITNEGQGLGIAKMLYEQFKNGYVSW